MNLFICIVHEFSLPISEHLFLRTILSGCFWYKNKQFHNILNLDKIYLEQMLLKL